MQMNQELIYRSNEKVKKAWKSFSNFYGDPSIFVNFYQQNLNLISQSAVFPPHSLCLRKFLAFINLLFSPEIDYFITFIIVYIYY